jgi:hypothetical protein
MTRKHDCDQFKALMEDKIVYDADGEYRIAIKERDLSARVGYRHVVREITIQYCPCCGAGLGS